MAALAALGFGAGDFLGGRATRQVAVGHVLAWAHLIGLVAAALWVWADDAGAGLGDLVGGALAGLFGLGGLVFLYTGLARGRAAVVAPTAAVIGAGLPVSFGLVAGESVSAFGWTGIVAGLLAIWLVSAGGEESRRRTGFGHGVVAGAFFGAYFVFLASVGDASGMWPLVSSRAITTLLVFGVGVVAGKGWEKRPLGDTGRVIVGVGLLDMVGNAGYLVASRVAPIAIVAVVASLYPGVTVLLGRYLDGERMGRPQIGGLILGLGSVALLSIR